MATLVLSIFCRWPEAGKAKTRLIPGFGAEGAAAIYHKLLAHTITVARVSGLPFELRVTGAPPARFRREWGDDLTVIEQGDGDLSAKLRRVSLPAIIIGSDCPALDVSILQDARDALADSAAVIGPARDGGYYLLGLRERADYVFEGISWSTAAVFDETMARFAAKGITPIVLTELGDVDVPGDLDEWPDFLP
ncbi:MAG: TIGR04282 family arsenosugar biosynthesis glycosyltransferase [Pontixanthobacter sp.]